MTFRLTARTRQLVIVALTCALVAGCSGEIGRDKTAPVTGRITYAGQPVPEGRIIFYPVDGRRMAMGAIDASGNYELTTFDPQDGAFLGKHQVVIDAVREISSGPASPEDESATGDPEFKRLVPAIYADQSTSPLEAEVKDQDNVINFDIPK